MRAGCRGCDDLGSQRIGIFRPSIIGLLFAASVLLIPFTHPSREGQNIMNSIIWLVGAVVIVLAILSFFGLR